MFSLIYDFALLLLALCALPKLLWQWSVLGKYRSSLSQRLGIRLPERLTAKHVIWIHAVSMGETRAVIPLYKKLRASHPDSAIVISSTTETGHAEAKRSMPDAALHFFLPFDFSWIIRRIMARIHPNLLIFVESDFWYHLIAESKKQGARVFLINGKISERSAKRFSHVPFFTNRLFSEIDHLCVQSKRYADRFLSMGIDPAKMSVTGNLKFDGIPVTLTSEEIAAWKEKLGIQPSDRVIVLGSTHDPEEEGILAALDSVWKEIPQLKVLIVPRHPERFGTVASQLRARGITLATYTERAAQQGTERVVLIDAMGLLNTCYQLAEIALVGGSFTDKVGGHNIFEPILLGVPVLFGPHMYTQQDLVELVLSAHAGKQISYSEVAPVFLEWLKDETQRQSYATACKQLAAQTAGSVERTLVDLNL